MALGWDGPGVGKGKICVLYPGLPLLSYSSQYFALLTLCSRSASAKEAPGTIKNLPGVELPGFFYYFGQLGESSHRNKWERNDML